MQKHQQLQQLLNEVNFPNLEDRLKRGIEVTTVYDHYGTITFLTNLDENHFLGFDESFKITRNLSIKDISIVLGYPISLELIIAALEKKEINYIINRDINSSKSLFIVVERKENIWFNYTPLQPLPQESVEELLEIFK